MKPSPKFTHGKLARVASCLLAVTVLLALAPGCSTLGVRIDKRPGLAARMEQRRTIAGFDSASPASRELQAAQIKGISSGERLAHLLNAASLAESAALDGNAEARRIYDLAVTQVIARMRRDDFSTSTVSAGEGTWTVSVKTDGTRLLDPVQARLVVPAAGVHIRGLRQRSVQSGFGVPYVLGYARNSPFLAGQPGVPPVGLAFPATALLTFKGKAARLEFYNPLMQDSTRVRGRKVRLAADFSAPLAVLVSKAGNRSLDVRTFLLTRQRMNRAGLYQFQPYDPQKIPVVFVHGLLSRPEAWVQACNTLLGDPEIRSRYQFWFLLYPTGLPVWSSAALLRSELDRYHRELERDLRNPNLHRIVLVGHSMGGLISSLNIRRSGEEFWRRFSSQPFQSLALSLQSRRQIEELIFFPPRTDIGRAVFIATPHRGSQMALNPIASFFARLIRLPESIAQADRRSIIEALNHDYRSLITMPANSIRFLKADSPIIKAIRGLPLARPIPYHSIIGDRGRGDSPNSSDGVVAYWSSHLEGATSEKIVPSGHGAQEDPAAIEELRRILLENSARR